jgi:hypothetical protein
MGWPNSFFRRLLVAPAGLCVGWPVCGLAAQETIACKRSLYELEKLVRYKE